MSLALNDRRARRAAILFCLSLLILAYGLISRLPEEIANISVPAVTSTETVVARLMAQLERDDQNSDAQAQLGLAYLQLARETADTGYYDDAEAAFSKALALGPAHVDAMVGQGMLYLSRHQFGEALNLARQARRLNPYRADILGIIADAYTELGAYEEALATLQAMVDLKPSQASYSRVSYQRELHGEQEGAIAAMQAAVAAGSPQAEGTLWARAHLGELYFNQGDWDEAERVFNDILRISADNRHAQAGIGLVLAARGEYAAAITTFETLLARWPDPEFAVRLAELYEVTGEVALAERAYAQAESILRQNAAAGMNEDLELALMRTDRGIDPAGTVALAEGVYTRQPNIYAADVLAWALYKDGQAEAAQSYSREALRLGTRDALLHYHAGLIALANEDKPGALEHLRSALAINPAFSIRYRLEAAALLIGLEETKAGS